MPKFNPARLRKARTDAGMSREELAVHLKVSRTTIDNFESDRMPNEPSATQLALIAKRTHKNVEYFLRG